MGKVFMSGIVPQKTAPITFKSNFADNDWSTIIKACQANRVPDTWTVGSQKTMTINGTDYLIDIIGKNHDNYADGSGKAPLTFQMHNCYGTNYAMHTSSTNSGGWASCYMRSNNLPNILALMPSEVQSAIKEVNKLTNTSSSGSSVGTTKDKLFLLSEIEITGTAEASPAGEGTQYEYYTTVSNFGKNQGTSDVPWWTRSQYYSMSQHYVLMTSTGWAYDAANSSRSIAPAFCF